MTRPENIAAISRAYWLCRCDCGSEIIVRSSALKDINNGTQSCGCIKSKGEQTIIKILQDNNIVYEYQKALIIVDILLLTVQLNLISILIMIFY